jgi:hypothetical protein
VKRFALLALLLSTLAGAALPGGASAAEPFASGCPPEVLEEGSAAELNHNPVAKKSIVPGGATSVRLCRYWGFANASGRQTPKSQERAGSLRDQTQIHGRDALESLVLEFHELETVPDGTYHYPADEGGRMYAVFDYRKAAPVIIEIRLSGCRFVNGGGATTRALSESLQKKLERLLEGHRGGRAAHGEVHEKRAVAFPPPRVSYGHAHKSAKEYIEEACTEWDQCTGWTVGHCKRKDRTALRCPYTATLASGKVCRGGIGVRTRGGAFTEVAPGVQSESEGECFLLFVPAEIRPEFEEELEHPEAKEAEEATKPKHPHSG